MIAKVSLAFLNDDTDGELLVDTNRIISMMTGNAAYPAPDPTLADVGTARTDFSTALTGAANGGSAQTVIKDQKREVLTGLLRDLATYVQKECNNDLPTLLSSGFLAQKQQRPPAGVLPAPDNLRLVRPELSGQLKARVSPVANASAYKWRYATSLAPNDWKDGGITTAASNLLENLTPGTIYVVQVQAIGSAGPGAWSDPAMLMAV
jgi:hypothetical protein